MLQGMKLMIFIFAIVLILSVTFVYARWQFVSTPPASQSAILDVSLGEFLYRPEEVLPDDDEADKDLNHLSLVGRVLDDMTYGLNNGSKPIIHNVLNDTGYLYCEQHTTQGQIKKLLLDGTDSENVRFVIAKISDTEYHIYTYNDGECDDANLNSTEIVTYKTYLIKGTDGVWTATESHPGYAQVFEPNVKHVDRAVNVSTWRGKEE